jgi:anti-sigma factor RsiW
MAARALDSDGAAGGASPSDCEALAPLLDGAAAGELGAGPRADVETHLAACDRCRAEVARYRRLRQLTLQVADCEGSDAAPEAVVDRIIDKTLGRSGSAH